MNLNEQMQQAYEAGRCQGLNEMAGGGSPSAGGPSMPNPNWLEPNPVYPSRPRYPQSQDPTPPYPWPDVRPNGFPYLEDLPAPRKPWWEELWDRMRPRRRPEPWTRPKPFPRPPRRY